MSVADFDAAVALVRSLPKDGRVKVSNAEKLVYYGLFKQATEGDITGEKPWAVQVEARAKWEAWAKNKGMNQEEAKKKYVETLVAKAEANGIPWNTDPEVAMRMAES